MESAADRRYRDESLLGRGGMGAVYRVFDSARGETVALKRLLIDATTRHREERIALFHNEYRTLAEIDHPCVIRVYDFGIHDEGPYYTMELLAGSDLATSAPLPWRQACSIVRDVCSSLALLHSRGYVHRDVSPLNVRYAVDGRGKLIDFGAMVPMGVSALTMGTPPCIAPEALRREPLDGRTDLFALGATLYFAVTGRQAFPARHLMDLRMAHERTPRTPSTIVQDIPSALDRLLLSLLSVDPTARPRSAAEVMERLTILANLAPIEHVAVHQAYLNTPALVGREEATRELSEGVRRLSANRSVVLCVRATGGGGRSRMLQVGMTEARLLGMTVVSASASDASRGRYGVLRALLTQLHELTSGARAALMETPLLAQILTDAPNDDASTRASIMNAFSTLIGTLAVRQPIVFAVDDMERCDEPSSAALLTLAVDLPRTPLAVLYTTSTETAEKSASALALLQELSRDILLPSLDEAQSEALLGSVFGQVPNLSTVSRYVFERAAGNPRATMTLAQVLVDRGFARYELGSWTLPGELAADALPASLSDVRRTTLADLPEDARELADVFAIIEGYGVPPDELLTLTAHADPLRLAAAHQNLLHARVVDPLENQALADRGWLELIRQTTDARRSQEIHVRLADRLMVRGANAIDLAHCLFGANETERAIDQLCGALATASLVDYADVDYPELLEHALAKCEVLARPRRNSFLLRRELLALSDRFLLKDLPVHFREVLRQLSHDSGLDDWARLDTLPDNERLTQALTAAQARYDSSDDANRVTAPIDAIRGLAETVYTAGVYAALTGDPAVLDDLPSLAPFVQLSPAIAHVISAVNAQAALVGARYEEALEQYGLRLQNLDDAGLSEAQLARSRPLLHYALGALKAGLGIEGALEHANILDGMPRGEIMAAAVRENYFIRRGNTRAAKQWHRRRELLQIQLRRPHALKLRQATQQLESSAHADDLEETKRNLEVLQELSHMYPSLTAYVHYGRAEYERIRGDYHAGLQHVALALGMTRPGIHPVWPWAAGCEIGCLHQLRQLGAAHERGLERVASASAAGLLVMRGHMECFLALVEGELGMFDSAVARLDRGIAYREQYGMLGLNLGWSYEARARLALWMHDQVTFERCLTRCMESYQGERNNPALASRHELLIQEARAQFDAFTSPLFVTPDTSTTIDATSVGRYTASTTWQTFIVQPDRAGRAHEALKQLLDVAHCTTGRLYLLGEDGPSLVAGPPDNSPIRALVRRWLDLDDDDAIHTITGEPDQPTLIGNEPVWPVLLTCMRGKSVATAGVAALPVSAAESAGNIARVARELCHAFIELGDCVPRLHG